MSLSPNSSTPPATPAIEATRTRLRAQMPITDRWAYFDHAAVAPISAPAKRAITEWAEQAATQGDTVWLQWERRVERTRRLAADLVNAPLEEIALVPNTTAGINLVAEGLDWREGDNVVVLADEFPSNLYPWMHLEPLGVETRRVPTDSGRLSLDRLRQACDRRTRVVSVSWVGYATGYRQDLHAIAEIAHAAGGESSDRALFFLDAIQGLGVLPLDVQQTPIDFFAADGHKWLLGPEGAGVAFLREEHLPRLRPMSVGWNSTVGAHCFDKLDPTLKPTAARYEGGSANMPGMLALGASLELLSEEPTEAVTASLLDITDYLCDRLASAGLKVDSHRAPEPTGHDPRSGIVMLNPETSPPDEARRRCTQAGIATMVRGGRLRLSPHAYTSYDEVDHLVATLA